ncbi:MAG: CHAT domain-containing protein [Cyanobacteria bacterium J06639_14]
MRILRARRILRFFFLLVLTAGFCICQLPLRLFQILPVQATDTAQLVQQGVDAYRQNQYAAAIADWEKALTHYATTEASVDRAIIVENLARAHQQIGQPSKALAYWQDATAIYTARQNWVQVGRTLTAQAQAYSFLGQSLQAINLLCTGDTDLVIAVTDLPTVHASTSAAASPSHRCQSASAVEIARATQDGETLVAALGSLGEAYRAVQDYGKALGFLQQGLDVATKLQNPYYQALLHNSLGNTYREQAELNYQQAAVSLRSASGDAEHFHSKAQQARKLAFEQFTDSQTRAQQAGYPAIAIKALLGLMALYAHTSEYDQVVALRDQAVPWLAQLPPNQEKVYLTLQLTKQRQALADTSGMALTDASYEASRSLCRDIIRDGQTWTLLEQAHVIADGLGNNRLKAFTQGEIGHFYECHGEYESAAAWTQQARLAASGDRVLALDTLYLWQWQMGRIYKALGQFDAAIESYTQAANNLNRVRDEILASNQNLQFDFRDAVAPVYRELAEIQLSRVPTLPPDPLASGQAAGFKAAANVADSTPGTTSEDTVRDALSNIDNLQLAALQNYFGSDCIVPITERRLDETLVQGHSDNELLNTTALISTIIFADKTAVILTRPNRERQLHWINQPENEFRQTIIDFRNSLEDTANELEGYDTQLAENLYQAFITPFEQALQEDRITTLVFVSDGILRNIPMAALYDGKQYLMQRYAIAIAPSLQQTAVTSAAALDRQALVLGLSQDSIVNGEWLGSLPAVRREVQDVVTLLPGSDLLLNEELTQPNLQKALTTNTYPVLHIATHGQFGTDPNETFLVMGDKEPEIAVGSAQPDNRLLRLGELDTLIREGAPQEGLLELIVLSACQTASGDERSTLGLAGVTIRAGAQSALASLWAVSDEATADLITAFYQGWQSGLSKAEALSAAQQAVLSNPQYLKHPAYWSAFVLVGDWQ